MKLLQKRTIDLAKANERKIEIDNGLALARRVDSLREARITEEENLKKYRETALKQVQYEIGQFIEERDNLKKQNDDARILRDERLKPLDEEWLKINLAKNQIDSEKKELIKKEETFKIKETKLEKENQRIYDIRVRLQLKEKEKDKTFNETAKLKEMALQEYTNAKGEHDGQTKTYEQKMLNLRQSEREYEVGIETNKIKEGILKEEKEDLIIREKDLARQQRTVQLAWEQIKKHGQSTDNK